MKKCPFCSGALPDGAVKCIYCGKVLQDKPPLKWYFKTKTIVIVFLCVGPFALPLVWIHPRLSKAKKIIITVIVLILTYILGRMFMDSLKNLNEYMQILSGQGFPGL